MIVYKAEQRKILPEVTKCWYLMRWDKKGLHPCCILKMNIMLNLTT